MTRLERWLMLGFIVCVWALISTRAQQGSPTLPSYPINVHITTTSTTIIKSTPGTLHTLNINTPGASAVVTVYDIAGAGCTGTPSASTAKHIFNLPASGIAYGTALSDAYFVNGICVQDTVAASDITAVAF